jgi:hypothetical protein
MIKHIGYCKNKHLGITQVIMIIKQQIELINYLIAHILYLEILLQQVKKHLNVESKV